MAEICLAPDTPELRARWGGFAWTPENAQKARAIIACYPEGRQRSAVMGLLELAQRQIGVETRTQGWLPIPVMEFVGRELDMPAIRVVEVATFYTMFNLVPVGRFHVQVCRTTPCWLRGSDDILAACKARGMVKSHTTPDGMFTLSEVECMGNCSSAPMFQINDDNYEDLTAESAGRILDELVAGRWPKVGTQLPGRHTVEPLGGPTTLTAMVDANHDYRGEW